MTRFSHVDSLQMFPRYRPLYKLIVFFFKIRELYPVMLEKLSAAGGIRELLCFAYIQNSTIEDKQPVRKSVFLWLNDWSYRGVDFCPSIVNFHRLIAEFHLVPSCRPWKIQNNEYWLTFIFSFLRQTSRPNNVNDAFSSSSTSLQHRSQPSSIFDVLYGNLDWRHRSLAELQLVDGWTPVQFHCFAQDNSSVTTTATREQTMSRSKAITLHPATCVRKQLAYIQSDHYSPCCRLFFQRIKVREYSFLFRFATMRGENKTRRMRKRAR